MTTITQLNQILEDADCLMNEQQINAALDKMAQQITADLGDKLPLVLCVMNGGLIPTAALIERLGFPIELDYIHATRYGMATEGTSLNWISYPQTELKDRHILVVDDIFDQGHTLQAIIKWLEQQGTSSVYTATVINKLHDRKTNMVPDYIGADVEDRFLFGYGMDYKGYFRNLKGIYAVKGS
ncbi:hypoxanthine-guanine phosphoribosyltransferase [Marinomonas sp. THO17]|uniref:hypoxanthine-guanine phosphoribosyltransferase n=1 Tax=Marinomonas sp. THO17 TaxID=3149048 RepID=UPI00336BF89F